MPLSQVLNRNPTRFLSLRNQRLVTAASVSSVESVLDDSLLELPNDHAASKFLFAESAGLLGHETVECLSVVVRLLIL